MVVGCVYDTKGCIIHEILDLHEHHKICTIRCLWAQNIMGNVLTVWVQPVGGGGEERLYPGEHRPSRLQAVCLQQRMAA